METERVATTFTDVWRHLAPRLERVLRSRRVPSDVVEDLLQETGIRIYRMWDEVDPDRVWALANTVLGNLVRDEMRKQEVRERHAAAIGMDRTCDFEEVMLYRLELRRVEKVLRKLSSVDRDVLLAEWGEESRVSFVSPAALKMARMRARRRLRDALERASSLGPVWRLREAITQRARTIMTMAEQLSPVATVFVAVAASGLVASSLWGGALGEPFPDSFGGAETEMVHAFARDASDGPGRDAAASVATAAASDPIGLPPGIRGSGVPEERMNENFGPVRTDGHSVWIGEGSGLGPYGAEQGVETSVAGNEVGVNARAYYRGPKCPQDIYILPPSNYMCRVRKASGRIEVKVGDKSYAVDTEDLDS